MAEITPADMINSIHGKFGGRNRGYFYTRNGKQFYRERMETYQAKQSPRQKWNSAAFAYAHKQLRAIESDSKTAEQMRIDYEAAHHKAPNGKTYMTVHAWKFNTLLYDWKLEHPFEE